MNRNRMVLLKQRRWFVIGFAMLIVSTLACTCMSLETGALVPEITPTQEPLDWYFGVSPDTLVCSSEIDQVLVEWGVTQPEGCTWDSPAPTGCHRVRIESDPSVIAPPVAFDDYRGSRRVTLTENTTFRFYIDDELVSSLTRSVANTGDRTPTYNLTAWRSCIDCAYHVGVLELNAMFSECVNVGPICNENDVTLILTNRDTGVEHRLEPGECTPYPLGSPAWYLVREEVPSLDNPCACPTAGATAGGSDSGNRELDPFRFSIDDTTCGEWDADLAACFFAASFPIIEDAGGSSDGDQADGDKADGDQAGNEVPGGMFDKGSDDSGGGSTCTKSCGNQVCEPACGETPNSCPADC